MSNKGSVFQKGGGGTNFEQAVQTAFLTTLIIRGNAPLNHTNEVVEIALQTTNRGCETDDLLVIAKSALGQHKLLIQIKHNISFTEDSDIFKQVINGFWKDYNNADFDKAKDKLIIIKNGFTKDERNHVKSILNWANTHATENDFITEVNRIKAKKERLDIFRKVLKEANSNTPLTDRELWGFLKCVDVLEYDFTNQNSIDETYFLNLIKLCKNNDTSADEKNIWDSILSFVTKLNKDGGSVTTESIHNEVLYKHFDTTKLSPFFKAAEKLKSDSSAILTPLKNTIGGFHLERENITQSLTNAITNSQFTIVTGRPGVGKSAAIRDFLKKEFSNASIFVFRADQFNEPHIANVFSSQGVNETIPDIFSCISLIPDKIIFIDSLEKLLEADPECAFKQFLALLKEYPDIKVIGSSRKYAVDLIIQKFGIDKSELGSMEVLPLEDNELNIISEKLPQLQVILKNEKIKKLLQSPKYLDFSLLALGKSQDDYTDISLTAFKDKLWNSLVVDSTNTKNGLPIKRENAFMEIAINRAKEMKLFTKPVKADAEAIVLLEKDEILFQENQNRKYSPSHDILEDWALVKYVATVYEEYPKPKELFTSIGNEPSIRRAFRLWIEDYLIDDSVKINELIKATIADGSIERYWADELLIAVFKSEDSSAFFSSFEKELLDQNAIFLNRCLHIIKTCCKESNLIGNGSSFLLPIGSGWKEALLFIQNHIKQLSEIKISIANFLFDWHYRLILHYQAIDKKELAAAKSIVLEYITEVESGAAIWQERYYEDKAKSLVSILLDLAEISKEEIKQLVERAFANEQNRELWKLHSFYESVIDKCLSGTGNQRFLRALPDLIVETAWKEWKLRPIEEPAPGSIMARIGHSRLDNDECWGIEDKFSFFPSGIYKTPFYNLLSQHPLEALRFIIDFINYGVDFYINAECHYKHEFTKIEIELNDGTKVIQWASWELWAAYRGSSVTHYAIESLLMSLEKFLLETAAKGTDISKDNLGFIYNYVLKNSNNAATSAVLTSVAMAYPKELVKEILPILSIKEFYQWDLNRALQESGVLAPMDDKISFAQEERWKSNQLPHRTKYMRGLMDFILDYQFNIQSLNKEIHLAFDKLNANLPEEDVVWKKTITEIDIRNHKIGDYDKELGGFPIQPEYDEEVTEFIESNKDIYEADTKSLRFSGQLTKAYEGKEILEFSNWNLFYEHYSTSGAINTLFDRQVTLAVLGLRDFTASLTKDQKEWCINTLLNTISNIISRESSSILGLNMDFNLLEKQIALSAFHLLFASVKNDGERDSLLTLMIYTLSTPFASHEIDKITEYIRTVFFKLCPTEGQRLWYGLIQYAKFRKANPYYYDDHDAERLRAAKEKEELFIKEISGERKEYNLNLSEVTLDIYEAELITRAFLITPYHTSDVSYADYIKHYISLLISGLNQEEDYLHSGRRDRSQIHSQSVTKAQFYIVELLVNANSELGVSVLNLVADPVYQTDLQSARRNNVFEFSLKIPEYVISKLDHVIAYSNDENLNKLLIENFWLLWQHLFEKAENSNKIFFTKALLLDIKWKKESAHWKALEGKKEFYHKMFKKIGVHNTEAIVNVFSTVGEKTFLPEGISWLVEIYKENMASRISLASPQAEQLIKRLFYNHIAEIKSNNGLIADFLWILDMMVDFGSSEAYLFRENVITYKKTN